ncbi:MAG: hypothetical protein Q8930_11460 [Bacillota bacterium]|nr:hypothetical protein [Bacillota bacterium]
MKKFISALLTLSLVLGTSTAVFAEGNDTTAATQEAAQSSAQLTPEQQQARDAYLKEHFDDMNQLVALRQQTRDAVSANNDTSKQIKEKVKAKTTQGKDMSSKLKDLASQRKALVEQAKQLQQQRLSLRSQYRDAVKARDVDKMKSMEQQILDLNKQVADLKAQDDAIKAQVAPLKDQLKSMRDSNQQLKDNVKTQLQQAKSIGDTVKALEQEKAQLWKDYAENIKNKDYTAAGTTFKQIIEKKSAILEDIKQRGVILNQILTSLS